MATDSSDQDRLRGCFDLTHQTPHGGQEWRHLDNFLEDFSVTTNPLGPPQTALAAAAAELPNIVHYPASNYGPAVAALLNYMLPTKYRKQGSSPPSEINPVEVDPQRRGLDDELSSQLLLGNGASELIELCVRNANCWQRSPKEIATASEKKWRPGPFIAQYSEYGRVANANGWQEVPHSDSSANLLCMVNPCNPTGDFLPLANVKEMIDKQIKPNSTLIVDESMLPFQGWNWQEQSLLYELDWLRNLAQTSGKVVLIIHSWTKFFACPGLRIGSVMVPTPAIANRLKQLQMPWSLNSLVIPFIVQAVKDTAYIDETYRVIQLWRSFTAESIECLAPKWIIGGVQWQPFLWINTLRPEAAQQLSSLCSARGVPIRWCRDGYACDTFVRIAVRHPKHTKIVLEAVRDTLAATG